MNCSIPKMLVIAPHPDDSILGAGGTITRFAQKGGEVTVMTIATHQPPVFPDEISRLTVEEAKKAHSVLGVKESIFLDLPALFVSRIGHYELNKSISVVLQRLCPNILLVPYFDRHIDHRAIFESCLVSARPPVSGKGISLVAAYEILSSTHYNVPHIEPNFTPNWIVDISDFIDIKIRALKFCKSQIGPIPHPRSCEASRALALFRGSQAGMAYGEGFYIIRMIVSPETLK